MQLHPPAKVSPPTAWPTGRFCGTPRMQLGADAFPWWLKWFLSIRSSNNTACFISNCQQVCRTHQRGSSFKWMVVLMLHWSSKTSVQDPDSVLFSKHQTKLRWKEKTIAEINSFLIFVLNVLLPCYSTHACLEDSAGANPSLLAKLGGGNITHLGRDARQRRGPGGRHLCNSVATHSRRPCSR